jgi:hypothetical protein
MDMESSKDFDNFSEISNYLCDKVYPAKMKGKSGLKVNFKRRASQFIINSGELFYKHKPHRTHSNGKYTDVLLSFIVRIGVHV